jgi:hypothetical protein
MEVHTDSAEQTFVMLRWDLRLTTPFDAVHFDWT